MHLLLLFSPLHVHSKTEIAHYSFSFYLIIYGQFFIENFDLSVLEVFYIELEMIFLSLFLFHCCLQLTSAVAWGIITTKGGIGKSNSNLMKGIIGIITKNCVY